MADESSVLPTSRIARWLLIGLLPILLGALLYFRDGRRVPPLPTPPPAGQPGN
jgi:hypothetical protein